MLMTFSFLKTGAYDMCSSIWILRRLGTSSRIRRENWYPDGRLKLYTDVGAVFFGLQRDSLVKLTRSLWTGQKLPLTAKHVYVRHSCRERDLATLPRAHQPR